jgi:hypothetical protein
MAWDGRALACAIQLMGVLTVGEIKGSASSSR